MQCGSFLVEKPHILNIPTFELRQDYFPVISSTQFLEPSFYEKLKESIPRLLGGDYPFQNYGQKHRRNISFTVGSSNLQKLKESNEPLGQLYDYLNSSEWKNYFFNTFNQELLNTYGFKGSFENISVDMNLSESTDNYENPYHVDTRVRVAHMMIYLGDEEIKEGGEICIGKYAPTLQKWEDYPQFPNLKNIGEETKFKSKDNFGLIVLSTPNSYHKGAKLVGKRRFIYIGFNSKINPAWKCGWYRNSKCFEEGLKMQKNKQGKNK